MPRQIPLDLIHRLQISLRAESNLDFSSFNNSSIPDIPTLEESIADFGDDDDDGGGVRCGGCKGRLLRGTESMICVYCGRGNHSREESKKPGKIGFNGTVGFAWLMESLGLDGSEMVAPIVDDNQTNRRKSSQIGQVPLSEFLNFEMEWPDDSERFGVTVEHETNMPGERLLHLAGVELGGSFLASKTMSIASTEQVLSKDTLTPTESAVLQRHGNLGLSENQQSTEASSKLDVVEEADSFSGWEADFQSASFDTQHVDVKSFESSVVHAVDYGPHMDPAYENAGAWTEGSIVDVSVSETSSSNWVANEHLGNPIGETVAGKSEVMTAHNEDTTFSQRENISSASVDWFENLPKTSSTEVPSGVELASEKLDNGGKGLGVSSDVENNQWGTVQASVSGNKKQSVHDGSLDDWDDFAGSSVTVDNRGHESSFQGDGNDPLDAWDDFASSSVPQDNQIPTRIEDGTGNLGAYTDDIWNSFTSFASTQKNQQSLVHDQIQFDPLGLEVHHSGTSAQPDYFQANTSKSISDDKPNKDESPFDFWNALQSSSHKQETQEKNNHVEVVDNKMGDVLNLSDDWGDFMSLGKIDPMNNTNLFESRGNDDGVESFDAGNEFASSTSAYDDKATAKDSKIGTWHNVITSDSVHLKNSEQALESKMSAEEDDMFDSWGDFRSSGDVVDNRASSNTSFDNGKVGEDVFSGSIPLYASMQNSDRRNNVPNIDDPMNEWGNFGSLAHVSDKVSPVSGSIGSGSKIMGEGDHMFDWVVQSTAETSDSQVKNDGPAAGQDSEDLDTDDAWTDFTSSKVVEGDHGLGSSSVCNDSDTINHSDPFDSWTMLMNSSGQTGDLTQFPKTQLVSNSHDVNHSSLQPDLFPGLSNNLNGTAQNEIPFAADPSWFWMKNENREAESNSKDMPTSQEDSEIAMTKSSDIGSLISQMHDLSFMLESSLSIPKR